MCVGGVGGSICSLVSTSEKVGIDVQSEKMGVGVDMH